jgi:Glycosyl hydrolases family 18
MRFMTHVCYLYVYAYNKVMLLNVNKKQQINSSHQKKIVLAKHSLLTKKTFSVFVLLFAVVGGLALLFARAATNSDAIDPEIGIVSGNATIVNDSSAVGGKAVQFNAPAAQPPASPPPPVTNGKIPAKFVGGYLEAWRGLYPSQIPAEYTLLFHAFAGVNSDGSVRLIISGDRQRFANEYKARAAQGKPTILSIGGAGGAQAGLTNATQVTNFVTTVAPLIEEFGFAGIDWDLELHVPGGISANGMVSASRQLKTRFGANFAITMAPFEGIETQYKEAARQLGNDLTFVGYQFYNMEAKVSGANAVARLEEWVRDTGIRPDQFSLGLWYGPDDYKLYTVEESLMASIYSTVNAKYPTVRGAWIWGISYTDQPRGFPFPRALTPIMY